MKNRFFLSMVIISITIIFSAGCHQIGGPGKEEPPPPTSDDQYPTLSVQFDRDPAIYDSGDTVEVIMDVSDDSGNVTVTMTLDGTDVPVNLPTTSINTTGFPVGSAHTVSVTATDPAMNSTAVFLTFTIRDPDDNTPPIVEINTPTADSSIIVPVDIVGTVSDDNYVHFTLEYAPEGITNYTPFATGDTPVNNDVLGVFDPTLLLNGLYSVRLTATDANGQSSSASIVYLVKGDLKLGYYSITLNDLSIPVAGIPITINRTYDSRRRNRKGDFGYGWTIELGDIRLEENGVTGKNWQGTVSGGFFPTYCIEQAKQHIVTITFSDGTVYEFEPTVNPQCQQLVPIQWPTVGFSALPGTYGTLIPLGGSNVYASGSFPGSIELLDLNTFMPYDADRYQLSLYDGRVMVINQQSGLESITDLNGNTLTLASNGIMHSTGRSVTFTRDAHGRITVITDPQGNMIQYTYDINGDLTSVTDQLGNVYQYTYNAAHGLVEIIDPSGIPLLRNEYDDSGRLIAQIDADGNRTVYEYDIDTRQETIIDPRGGVTVYEYDNMGNVLSKTDALGNITTFAYDAQGNTLSETDALGNTFTYAYDSYGNLLSETDPLGNTTTYTYNARGQELTKTDPHGNVTTCTYDSKGNPLLITDPLGNNTTFTYDAQGNTLSETDPLGNTFTYAYDSYGYLLSQTDPMGNTTTYTYNALGQKLTKTDPHGNVTATTYDSKGNLFSITDPLGNSTTFAYDAQGSKTSETDALGNTFTYAYDSYGNLLSETDPLGNTTMYTYNANGNVLTKTDFNGDTINYTYDALNRLVNKMYPDATSVSFTYTATGKYAAIIDSRGTSSYSYDAMNRLIQVFNPDGTGIFYTYDGMGNRISITVSSGTTSYAYDALNRLITVTDPDGGVTSYSYDAAGNCTDVTYPNDSVIEYAYDATNRLTYLENKKSTGGVISSYSYTLDPRGNRVSVVENNGRTVIYTYNSLSRIIQEDITDSVLGNQTISYTYDAVGNRLTKTVQLATTNYTYDANNRLITRGNHSYTYDNNGNTLSEYDGVNTSTYTYDYENRLISAQKLGKVIVYTYDADGIRMSSTVGGVATVYMVDKNSLNTKVLEERDGNGTLIVRYVHGTDLISQKRGSVLSFYIYDGIGSTRQLIDTLEVLTDTHVFDAFGIELNRTGTTINKYLFIGEQYDSDIGFYYLEGRYYDQEIGRFITQN